MNRILLFAISILLATYANAQQRVLTGKVIDDVTQTPLPNATISVIGKGTSATLSDHEGNFKVTISGSPTIIVSYTGYEPKSIVIGNNQSAITVGLGKSVTGLEEVVVIGYGTQKRKDVTSAISSISAEQIGEMPVTNVNLALQGRVPGLQIVSGGNEPGAGTMARIRGINSINAPNGPLYVIDGVITTGDLREINPDDIESISVLKDASAAAIYGSRAAEGVIIITTKRGQRGTASINYHGYYGVQKVIKNYDFINGKEYELLRRLAYYDENNNPMYLNDTTSNKRYEGEIFSSVERNSIAQGKSYDWPSQILRQAPITSHTLSVSNGSEKNRLYVSGNYFSQGGIITNSDFKRYSLNASGETQLTSKLKALLTTNISHVDRKILDKQVYYNALTMSPLVPFSDSTGNNSVVLDPTKGTLFIINNPNVLTQHPKIQNEDRVFGSFALEYKILKGLLYRPSFNADIYSSHSFFYAPRTVNINNSYTNGGYGSLDNFLFRDYNLENILTYDFNLSKNHSFSTMAGLTFEKRRQEYNYMTGTGFPSDKLTYKDMSLASVKSIGSNFFNWSVLSQMARVIYKFKERYIINGSIRRDGVSYFGENNRYGVYPSVSAAWRIIDEPFLNGLRLKGTLSDAKFRIGYGIVGNYIKDYKPVYAAMGPSAYPFNGTQNQTGFEVDFSYLANKDLRWESQNQFNIGFDLGLFNNRVAISADYYNKEMKDLLMPNTLAPSTGWNSKYINISSMTTKGVDLRLRVDVIKTNNFQWQSEFNWSTYSSKITKLLPGKDSLSLNLREGIAPNSLIYDYVYDGLYQIADSNAAKAIGVKPGSVRIKDLNKDGKYNDQDWAVLGKNTPDGWGGWWNYWNYKGLSLVVFANYMYGHSIINKAYQDYLYSDGRRVVMEDGMNFWTREIKDVLGNVVVKENTNTNVPRPNAFGNSVKTLPGGTSSFIVQKADYIKIKNITIGYDLPSSIVNKLHARNLNVYIQFQDPFIITGYKGVDPEISQVTYGNWPGGSNYDIYPRYKTSTIGVKIGL